MQATRFRDIAHAYEVCQQYEEALRKVRRDLHESQKLLLRAASLNDILRQQEEDVPSDLGVNSTLRQQP